MKQFKCKICDYEWNTKPGTIKPKSCARRGCRSVLWNRGLDDCKFYVNKKYLQRPIKAEYNSEGCLIATGNSRGINQKYHSIRRGGKTWLLHRWVFYNYNGYEPKEEVMHTCNNTSCINPLHLKAGSHKENEEYKKECGRTLTGEKNPMSKLTLNEVLIIKKKLLNFKRGHLLELSKKYDISPNTISAIKCRKNYWTNKNGKNSNSAKLNWNIVKEIKNELIGYNHGLITRLSKQYNVSPTAIGLIKSGKNWK